VKPSPAPVETRRLPAWAAGLLFFWALGVAAFYLIQAPPHLGTWASALSISRFSATPFPEALRRLGRLSLVAAGGIGVLLLTLGLGGRIGRFLGLQYSNAWLELGWKIVLGIAGLQFLWLGTGYCGLWFPTLLGGALAFLFVLTLRDAGFKSRGVQGPLLSLEPLGWVLAIGTLLLGLALAFCPETFYDSLVYILAVPDEWLRAHGVVPAPGQMCEWFYLGASGWFANGLLLQGPEAAKFQAAALVPVTAFFAGGWAWEISGRPRSAVMAFGLTATFPLLVLNSWAARSDVLTALALLAGLYALQQSSREKRWSVPWGAAAGIAFGLAIATKYLAAIGLAAGALILFRNRVRPNDRRMGWVFAVPILLLVGPWAARNVIFTGNPLYPYLPDLFGGWRLPDWGLARLLYENKLTPTQFFSWPPIPWRAVMPGFDLSQPVGPWVVALVPLLLLFKFKKTVLGSLLGSSLLILGLGLLLSPLLRFQLASFLLLAVVLGASLGSLPEGSGQSEAARWVLGACLVVGAGMYLDVAAGWMDPIGVWTLRESQGEYLQRNLHNSYLPLTEWARSAVPPDGKLLILGEGRGLYFAGRVLRNSVDDDPFLAQAAREDLTLEDFRRRLRRQGITHAALNLAEGLETAKDYGHYSRLTPAQRERLKGWCGLVFRPLREEGGLALYAVTDPKDPAPPRPEPHLIARLIDAGSSPKLGPP